MQQSYFDGSVLHNTLYRLAAGLISAITLGIATPWALCLVWEWEAKHTVINGQRLQFVGEASNLFWKWMLWNVLTIITFGIYGFWSVVNLKKWQIENTRFNH